MKHLIKFSAALTLLMSLGLSACKKTGTITDKNTVDKTNYEELSKQIMLSIYNSLKSDTNALKTNSAAQIRTNGTYADYPLYPHCGDVVIFPTGRVVDNVGDTTRTTTANRVHTYICNNGLLNEYHLADTVTTRATTSRYKSVYTATQNYNTRNDSLKFGVPWPFQAASVSYGQIGVAYTQVKYNSNNTAIDSLVWTTRYTLNNVLTKTIFIEHAALAPGVICACTPYSTLKRRIIGGQATFTGLAYQKDNVNNISGLKQEHTGIITFIDAYTSRVTFFSGGFSSTYEIKTKIISSNGSETHDVITVTKL